MGKRWTFHISQFVSNFFFGFFSCKNKEPRSTSTEYTFSVQRRLRLVRGKVVWCVCVCVCVTTVKYSGPVDRRIR